ncbi:hypothetical protein CJ030_MR0G005030 [Morella rubra]|uniref:Uncharacterized protein n=1 Tax=Morella rubra TaxID=262757 RepID=A0A6A1UMX7_9ROSI|nr:hypothetical protein CJ030_MR0G005030 [Morella rubra]
MGFDRCFRVEAKDFQVSVSDRGVVRWSDWSRKSHSAISFGRYGVVWLVNLASKLLGAAVDQDVILKFNEGSRAFLAQRCANKSGRYVVVIEFGEGRRRGVVMVLEGRGGAGWKALAECFQGVVDHLGSVGKRHGSAGAVGWREGVSFVEVVKLGRQWLSMSSLCPFLEVTFHLQEVKGGRVWRRRRRRGRAMQTRGQLCRFPTILHLMFWGLLLTW